MERYTGDANCEESEFELKERKKDTKKIYKKSDPDPGPSLIPHEDKNFSGSLVFDFRKR